MSIGHCLVIDDAYVVRLPHVLALSFARIGLTSLPHLSSFCLLHYQSSKAKKATMV